MKAGIFELAALAAKAIRNGRLERVEATTEARPRVKVVAMDDCPVCHKRHAMGLGAPRCTDLKPVATISRGNPAYPFVYENPAFKEDNSAWRFPKVAMALLLGCTAFFSGCASSHFYVSGINIGAGETASDGKEVTAGIVISPNPYAYKAIVPLK